MEFHSSTPWKLTPGKWADAKIALFRLQEKLPVDTRILNPNVPPLFLIIFIDAVRIRASTAALKINMPVHAKFEKLTKDTFEQLCGKQR